MSRISFHEFLHQQPPPQWPLRWLKSFRPSETLEDLCLREPAHCALFIIQLMVIKRCRLYFPQNQFNEILNFWGSDSAEVASKHSPTSGKSSLDSFKAVNPTDEFLNHSDCCSVKGRTKLCSLVSWTTQEAGERSGSARIYLNNSGQIDLLMFID